VRLQVEDDSEVRMELENAAAEAAAGEAGEKLE